MCTSRTATIPTRSGYHASGTLFKTTETDEDEAVTITFTDVEGKVILERKVNGSENLDTYYVYDEANNLAYAQ